MKNLERLLQRYQSDPRTQQILAQLASEPPIRLHLTGLSGALEAFVMAATWLERPGPMLFIAADKEENHRVFVGSMMDIFEKPMPLVNSKGEPMKESTGDLRNRFFAEIIPNCQNLTFLLLTKRPSNINKYIPSVWKAIPPNNVMFGTSPVNRQTFDTLVPQLKKVNGRRFLSIEPQLSLIMPDRSDLAGIDWVIQGGESGPHKRPFKIGWAIELRDICANYNVPYFFKQIDKVQEIPSELHIRQFPR